MRALPKDGREPEYLSVEEAAQILHIDPRTVWTFLKASDDPIPSFKFGRLRRINKSELADWAERRRQTTQPSTVARAVDTALKEMGLR
jgi:excisionase family DNA binding protein